MNGSFKIQKFTLCENLKTFFARFVFVSFLSLAVFLFFVVVPSEVHATSAQLKISGNQIVTASGGCTVRLKGVDVSGMEYSPTGDGGTGRPTTTISGVTMTDYVSIITEAVSVWHANCVRFPINQDFWFGCTNSGGTPNQTAYRAEIQAVINYCSANNVYLDLDLHWSGTSSTATAPCGTGWGGATAQQDMPDMNAVTFWSSVASTYANNPAVMFDIYNEPHDVSWSIWRDGGAANGFTTPGLQALLTAVRNAGANNIVVAGGLNWAFDLTGLPANDLTDTGSGNGVLYSSHVYSSKGYPAGGSQWDTYITDATATSPAHAVIIEEFGATSSDGVAWDNSTIAWLNGTNDHNYVYSGMAWAFSSDVSPTLLTSFSGYPTTSYHGAPVSTWLAQLNQTPTPNCVAGSPVPTGTPTKTFTATPSFTPTATTVPPSITLTKTTGGPTSGYPETGTAIAMTITVCNASGSVTANGVTVVDNITNPLSWSQDGPNFSQWAVTVSGVPVTINPLNTSGFPITWVVSNLPGGDCVPIAFSVVAYSFNASDSCQVVSDKGTATWSGGGPVNSNTIAITVICNTPSPTPTSSPTNTPVVNTSTATKTATNSATPTATKTPTFTPSNSPTNTPLNATSTPTNSATNTATKTVTNSPTNTLTSTPTTTRTNTPANTSTSTVTSTTTNTATTTATSTPTKTVTNSPTNTSTSTATRTATATTTNTASNSPTYTSSLTPTGSPTNSPTRTFTATATNTLVNTATLTATSTSTRTATATTTNTASNSPTYTSSLTPTGSPTNSPTRTSTATATNTLINTGTPTSTATVTTTNTASNSPTYASSLTPTGTATNSPTRTSTATVTNTLINTGTPTSTATVTTTNTASNSPTYTSSLTPTGTATNSPTRTSTATATNTLINTGTPTSTATVTTTNTASNSPTYTSSLTPTGSPTNSPTRTSTATVTNTLINTGTPTSTATVTTTNTASNSPTYTSSLTPTETLTNSPTRTSTATATNTLINTGTPTKTSTMTPTSTATNTLVNTATATTTSTASVTPTFSPTPVTVSASQGSSPPGSSTQIPGASGVPIQQIQMNNPSSNPVTLTSITLTGTGSLPSGITSVNLFANGTLISTASFSGSNATFNFNGVIPGANGAVTYEVTANFSSSSPVGSYSFSATNATGSNGQPLLFTGLPVSGVTVTIVAATATYTPSSTVTSTATKTITPMPTVTATPTSTPSAKPVVYPNPTTGGTVQLNPDLTSPSDVSIEIFTIAFRKVATLNYSNVQPGASVPIPLVDKRGTPLASGLYYVVVQTNQGRSILKLLILR